MNKRPRPTSGRYVSRLTSGTLAVVMAGGRGERLKQLTVNRCKPATPFGGKFRIIDFVLSNCVNSGIRQICILTQYKAQSLIQHVQRGWGYLRGEFGEFVDVVPAQQQIGSHWYRGTADAVYQNADYIREQNVRHVLVLAGDHIYKMDYGPMIAHHVRMKADITIGVVEVPRERAREFGVLSVSEQGKVVRFAEKPADPEGLPDRPDVVLASMGIYIFNANGLERFLAEDAADPASSHDFGRDVIPAAIREREVYAYAFQDVRTQAQAYWRDVGTLDAYYEANMELIFVEPELNVYDEHWPIWTYQPQRPPAKFVLDDGERRGTAINSMISGGAIVSGATVRESLIFTDVHIEERSQVQGAVVLPNVEIGRGCQIRRAIIDEGCELPDGIRIGFDRAQDARRFEVTEGGVVVVTPDMLRGN
jgi:glucose-1-phosphate adenylyltransferase